MRIPQVAKITVESNTIILRQEAIIIIMNEKQKIMIKIYGMYTTCIGIMPNNYNLQ